MSKYPWKQFLHKLPDSAKTLLFKYVRIFWKKNVFLSVLTKFCSAHSCDTCSGLRVANGYRLVLTCQNLFGIKNLPVLFVSCTPECLQNLFTDDNENIPLTSRNSFLVNEKFLAKLKTHHM